MHDGPCRMTTPLANRFLSGLPPFPSPRGPLSAGVAGWQAPLRRAGLARKPVVHMKKFSHTRTLAVNRVLEAPGMPSSTNRNEATLPVPYGPVFPAPGAAAQPDNSATRAALTRAISLRTEVRARSRTAVSPLRLHMARKRPQSLSNVSSVMYT